MAKSLSILDWIAFVLVIIGGLNWGLVGVAKLDVVALLLGFLPVVQNIVYFLVGLAAAYLIYYLAVD